MLQLVTIEPNTLGLLKKLQSRSYLEKFFLVGGTALALQMGHRKSIDLDLFTLEDYNHEILLKQLQAEFEVDVKVSTPSLFITDIDTVKVDFVRHRYPLMFPMLIIDGVRMPDIKDIAPMKLDAVTKRGSKKDFYDIYYLLQRMSLREMLDLYNNKYKLSTMFHIIKSLTYFDDAEEDIQPFVFDKKITWLKVKRFIQKSVQDIYE